MAEFWAYCADCQRWYYCCPAGVRWADGDPGGDPLLPDCPVCKSPPTSSRIERETPETLPS